MSNENSLSLWVAELKQGNEAAAQRVWAEYFDEIARFADRKLGKFRRMRDGEDVALSAFNCLLQRARAGDLDDVSNSNELRRALIQKAHDKAVEYIRYELRKKRGGGAVRGESVFAEMAQDDQAGNIADHVAEHPDELFETLERDFNELLEKLDDDLLKEVAVLRIQGYSTQEIGEQVDLSAQSIRRKLAIIERRWDQASVE